MVLSITGFLAGLSFAQGDHRGAPSAPSAPSLESIAVPVGNGKPVLLDGLFAPGEWDDALSVAIHDRIKLLLKVNSGHLFLGLKYEDASGVITDLWLTSDDKTVYQMHSSGQLGEGVLSLPFADKTSEILIGYTKDWDANEIKSDSKKKAEWQAAGRPKEGYRQTLFPSNGKEYQIVLSKFGGRRLKMRLMSGDPKGLVIFPDKTDLKSTDDWLELVLPEREPLGQTPPSVFPVRGGPYLGQKPPGLVPEVFAPGIVSTAEFIDFKGAFSPDGQEFYFYRHALPEIIPLLLFTRIENGVWTKPAPLPVAQGARTYHPCVSPDNQWLFFFWQFLPEQNRPSGFYASARTPAGWSDPRYAGPGMYLTCDSSGRYFTTDSVWGDQPKHYLASTAFSQGRFSRPERLTIQPHYENQTHPCIAPDGSYIIFDINVENGSLYVSFKDKNGDWGEGIDLTKHGFKPDTRGAYISPDGKYLFFSVDGDIWWVSAKVIEGLRPKK